MTAQELVHELHRRGVQLTVAGDKLRYRPRSAVEPDLLPALREHKAEIMVLVADPATEKPQFHYSADVLDFGDIAAGWTPRTWATELRRKARCCDAYRADIAGYYVHWAADIERRLGQGEHHA